MKVIISEEHELLSTRRRRLQAKLGRVGEGEQVEIAKEIKELELRLLDMHLAWARKRWAATNTYGVRTQRKAVPAALHPKGMRQDATGETAQDSGGGLQGV